MFIQFKSFRGEIFVVNSVQVSCFFPIKKGSCIILADGSSWEITMAYAQLCALFDVKESESCQNV